MHFTVHRLHNMIDMIFPIIGQLHHRLLALVKAVSHIDAKFIGGWKRNEIRILRMKSKHAWMKSSLHPPKGGFHRVAISSTLVDFIR